MTVSATALEYRCRPRLILTQCRAEALVAQFPEMTVAEVNEGFWAVLHIEEHVVVRTASASQGLKPQTDILVRRADLGIADQASHTPLLSLLFLVSSQ
jgi:hypothetical protein